MMKLIPGQFYTKVNKMNAGVLLPFLFGDNVGEFVKMSTKGFPIFKCYYRRCSGGIVHERLCLETHRDYNVVEIKGIYINE